MNKEHILGEIIRITRENNGVPPGIRKFEKATGIRFSDWFGKYWTSWGEALKEAGYLPNKLTAPYDETILLQKVIALIREIGKFPTMGQIRLKHYHDSNFPSHNTISSRLGNKVETAKKLVNFCQGKPEYSDILEICRQIAANKQDDDARQERSEPDTERGFVYLMKSGRFYKIGSSKNVERRNYDIGIKLPEPLRILHKITTDDPPGIESYWHNRFRDKQKEGEWFDLSRKDISAFKQRKFM